MYILESYPSFLNKEVTIDVIIDTSEVRDLGETKLPVFLGGAGYLPILVSNCCSLSYISSTLSFLLSKTFTHVVNSENFDYKTFNF